AGGWRAGIVDGHMVKAKRYLRRGEFYGAQDELSRYAAARPEDGDAHAALARVHVQCGNQAGAKDSYAEACVQHLAQGRRGEAEQIYQEARRSFDTFVLPAEAQLNLCFGLERSLKPELALAAYEGFISLHHEHAEAPFALLRAANLHARQGETSRARECYLALVRRYPEDPWVDFATEHARRLPAA
ncbi:MAG: tetratricopeptide repeat protein, partial [Candidatus Krumholzibacteria bacterium]|nr:tetratricopeptide repeat protein [Candidatus Krumholzibacteria bacterium]